MRKFNRSVTVESYDSSIIQIASQGMQILELSFMEHSLRKRSIIILPHRIYHLFLVLSLTGIIGVAARRLYQGTYFDHINPAGILIPMVDPMVAQYSSPKPPLCSAQASGACNLEDINQLLLSNVACILTNKIKISNVYSIHIFLISKDKRIKYSVI